MAQSSVEFAYGERWRDRLVTLVTLQPIHAGACRCGGDLVLNETTVHDLDAALVLLESLDRPLNFGKAQFTKIDMPVTLQQYDCRNSPAIIVSMPPDWKPAPMRRPDGCGLSFKQSRDGNGRLMHRQGDPGKGIW